MRKLLSEIRTQPQHIREIFMWLCVIITFSVVSFFWFQSTTKEFVAMVNPQKAEDERVFAKADKNQPSLLGNIGDSFSSLKASLSDLFGFSGNNTIQFPNHYQNNTVSPNLFPASKDK